MGVIAFEENSLQHLQDQINSFLDENEGIEIVSCNYQAFETDNYASHAYSALIIYKHN